MNAGMFRIHMRVTKSLVFIVHAYKHAKKNTDTEEEAEKRQRSESPVLVYATVFFLQTGGQEILRLHFIHGSA